MRVTNCHHMTLAVKVALNLNTSDQLKKTRERFKKLTITVIQLGSKKWCKPQISQLIVMLPVRYEFMNLSYCCYLYCRQTQWDPPNLDTGEHADDMDLGTPSEDDIVIKVKVFVFLSYTWIGFNLGKFCVNNALSC